MKDFLKFIPFIQAYPFSVKIVVAIWLILTVAVIITLIFVKPKPEKASEQNRFQKPITEIATTKEVPVSTSSEIPDCLQKIPIFDFEITRHYQDLQGKYYDQVVFITNKGDGPAMDVTVLKLPLADDRLSGGGQPRVNRNITRKFPLIAVNDKKTVFREQGYAGKRVRIVVRCSGLSNCVYEFVYEGSLRQLQLARKIFLNRKTGTKQSF